jgi:glycosyltransferase involved in cell wall biosynthesis
LARFGVKGPYFLCVGNPYPHKNYETAIHALHVLHDKVVSARNYKLVIVGDIKYADLALYKLIEELKVKDDVIFTNFVDHDELVYLYNKAEVLLFCSLYEGFGNPPLEAMACGLPVVAANRGAVGEVTGSASILVEDPLDYKAFVLAIEKVLTDHTHRKRMIEEGLRRAAEFRWNKATQKVLNLYAELFEEGYE